MHYPKEEDELFVFLLKYVQDDVQLYSVIYPAEICVRVLDITAQQIRLLFLFQRQRLIAAELYALKQTYKSQR